MNHSVLIIDDEKTQAEQLAKALKGVMPDVTFFFACEEDDILNKIVTCYYNLAIVDLRMDKYEIDGFKLINMISSINPFAKIIAMSAYSEEYSESLDQLLAEGKIVGLSEKEDYDKWVPKLQKTIGTYFKIDNNSVIAQTLENLYAEAKNEVNTYKKGVLFENFVVILFRHMGFEHIFTRVIDEASNEKDIVVRNDINDFFFLKYGRYIYAECKNKPEEGFSKNDFIIFDNKVKSSYGDCDLGVVFTTGHIKRTVYKQALMEAKSENRIMYVSQPEIQRLIHASDILEEFKQIIDEQNR